MIFRSFLSFLIVAMLGAAALSQTAAPDATVRAFYAYSNPRSSAFNDRHVELRKKWYTTDLYKAFLNQLSEDKAYLKTNPTDKPYFGDGLTFRPLDEPCMVGERSYKRIQSVGRTQIDKSRATVEVSFAYPKACTTAYEPIVYRVFLHKVAGKWLIDDWVYGDGASLKADMLKSKYN